MLSYFLYFLAAAGLSYVLAASHITFGIRSWLADQKHATATGLLLLVECMACTGWHIGWLSVAVGIAPGSRTVTHALLLAFATAGSNLVHARISGLTKEH